MLFRVFSTQKRKIFSQNKTLFFALASLIFSAPNVLTPFIKQYDIYSYLSYTWVSNGASPTFVYFYDTGLTYTLKKGNTPNQMTTTTIDTSQSQFIFLTEPYIELSINNGIRLTYIFAASGFTGCENGLQVFYQPNVQISLKDHSPSIIDPIYPNTNRCFVITSVTKKAFIYNGMDEPNSVKVHFEGSTDWTKIQKGENYTCPVRIEGKEADVIFIQFSLGNFDTVPDLQVNYTGERGDNTNEVPPFFEIPNPTLKPTPDQTPKITPSSTPSSTPNKTPVETPSDTPKITPKETPKDTPKITPSDTPRMTPKDTPRDTPSSTPSSSPAKSPVETPKDTPSRTPLETTPFMTPKDTPSSTPSQTPLETTPVMTPKDTPTSWVPTPRWTVKPTQTPYFDGYAGLPYDPNPIIVAIKETHPPIPTEYVPQAVGYVRKVATIATGTIIVILIVILAVVNVVRSTTKVIRARMNPNKTETTEDDYWYSLTISISESEYSNFA